MTKDDFVGYRALTREVQLLRIKLKALCDPSGARYSLVPSAPSGQVSTLDDLAAIYAEQEALYLEKLAKKETMLLAIEQAIEELPVAERLVMRYRYIDGRSWRRVCEQMLPRGYSERQVYRLHGWALEKLKEV